MSMATTSPWLAVAAGMLTVGAPCVLPMLPVVLGASVAGGPAQRTRPLFIALGFALSFAAVALLFSSFTQVLGLSPEGLRRFAAVLLLVFGVLTVWPKPFQWLSQQAGGVLNRAASLGMGASAGGCGRAGSSSSWALIVQALAPSGEAGTGPHVSELVCRCRRQARIPKGLCRTNRRYVRWLQCSLPELHEDLP